jgi:hypothetical protein
VSWERWLRILRLVSVRLAWVGAQILEAWGRGGKQMPNDRQDGTSDGHEGFELAPAFDHAPVAFAQGCVGSGRRRGCLSRDALGVGVALAGGPSASGDSGLPGAGLSLAQDTRCPGVAKRLISRPTSAMMTCADSGPIPVTSSRRCQAVRSPRGVCPHGVLG